MLLVPQGKFNQFRRNNPKKHAWKYLEPGSTTSTNPIDKAIAMFHLMEPSPSTVWKHYIDQRTEHENDFETNLDEQESGELQPIVYQIKNGAAYVLSETDMELEQLYSIVDGVIPRSLPEYVDDEVRALFLTMNY